ncbi:TIM barrel protein [Clostridium sp. CTA-19]
MIKSMSMSTYKYDLARYDGDFKKIEKFLENNKLEGIELLGVNKWDDNVIPKRLINGVHLSYYPIWIDFWKGNMDGLKEQFKDEDTINMYYGGLNKDILVEKYKKEIEIADEIGAKYVVFHVSHVELKSSYNYKFKYNDKEVLDATAELVNEIFKGLNTNIEILFENLWWPGLTLLDDELTYNFIESIKYNKKGILLDTGHLLNTNKDIENMDHSISYIKEVLNNLKKSREFIKGMHLNYSESGSYVKEKIKKVSNNDVEFTIDEMFKEIHNHIIKIDQHKPFNCKDIKDVIDKLNLKYLTYEFITRSLDELDNYIKIQNKVLE